MFVLTDNNLLEKSDQILNTNFNIYDNLLSQIGKTPVVKLTISGFDIYGKCEYLNPGGSIKDRAAKYLIEQAEKSGMLKPGGVIIEGSSGNQGIALAMIGALKGYKVIITVPYRTSKTKVNILKAYGAEVKICDEEGERGYVAVARYLARTTPNSYMPDQYYNILNTEAHYHSTGPDIWRQTQGKVTHVVIAMGTCGTITGVAKFLKSKNPNIKIWGVDAETSERSLKEQQIEQEIEQEIEKKIEKKRERAKANNIDNINDFGVKLGAGISVQPYQVEGIGVDVLDGLYSPNLIDEIATYSDDDIFAMTKKCAQKFGLLVGLSSAAVLKMIEDKISSFKKDDYVIAILADSGRSYLDKVEF